MRKAKVKTKTVKAWAIGTRRGAVAHFHGEVFVYLTRRRANSYCGNHERPVRVTLTYEVPDDA